MAHNQTSSIMSTSMNMAITIFGFVLSALFIMVICCRLLCSRFRQSNGPLDMFQTDRSTGSFSVERSLQGLEPSVVTCFPTVKYNQQIFTTSEDNLCTICLGDYKEREVLRILPRCGHAFHVACIDVWLRQHHTCPVCRISLRIFSEWRQISGPLISLVAKPRFVPGALPDHLFEEPKNIQGVPAGLPTVISKRSLGCPVIVTDRVDLETGESSSWRHHESLGLDEGELESGDRQQLLEPKLIVASDCSSHNETGIISANTPTTDSKPMRWNGCLLDASREEQSSEVDTSFHRNVVAVRSQAGGPSFQICSIDEKSSLA